MVCRNPPPNDGHHIRVGTGGGMATKPGDENAVPLCRPHHTELHQVGERTFWGRFSAGVDGVKKLALGLYDVTGDTIAALRLMAGFR